MKTKLSAPFSELRGKLGALVGQQRKSGGAFVLRSDPYTVTGLDRNTTPEAISGFNFYIRESLSVAKYNNTLYEHKT